MADAVTQGETAPGSPERGDFLQGMDGDDVVIGTAAKDLIGGGEGKDVLVGGAGDDFLSGDGFYDNVNADWSVTVRTQTDPVTQVTTYTFVVDGATYTEGVGAADSIYAGAGNDGVLAGGGDDYVSGDAGDDILFGGAGADMLLGGDGKDVLNGDNGTAVLPESQHGDDYLDGGAGNDQLFGAGGADVLYGGTGNDLLMGDAADIQAGGADYLDGEAGEDTLVGGGGDDTLFGGDDNDQLFGDGDDVLVADQGADYLDGGAGDDYLRGYGGNDQLFGGDGADRLFAEAGDDFLDGGSEDDWLEGGAGNDVLIGGAGNNTLLGGVGDDELTGGEGNDYLLGDPNFVATAEQGNDILDGGAGNDYLRGYGGNDQLSGGDGADQLFGDDGTDSLDGGVGDDQLDGGPGADVMVGGLGNDTYVADDPSDVVVENADEGIDTVQSAVSYALPANVENALFTGSDAVIATGNELDNVITGTSADDRLAGGPGNDTLIGGAGSDDYVFAAGDGQDVVRDGGTDEDLNRVLFGPGIAAGQVAITREGDDLVLAVAGTTDQIRVEAWFADRASQVAEVQFDDGTVVDLRSLFNQAPVLTAAIPDRNATEDQAFQYIVPAGTFGDDVWDRLTFQATRGDGSALPAWLTFDAETRTFTGTPANDDVGTLGVAVTATDAKGLAVSDTFEIAVANVNDAPVLASPLADRSAPENTPFDFTLPADTFMDVDLGDTLGYTATQADGTPLPSWLTFAPATRTFQGTPPGGSAGTTVPVRVTATDLAGASATGAFALAIGTVLTGTAGADRLIGSGEADLLQGLAGADRLDGGPGADTLVGGDGGDTYVVDDPGDLVVENAGEGWDTVQSSVSYALPENVEDLTLTGTADLTGTGNALDNTLLGNAGANTLEGGLGYDTLDGGLGADTLLGGPDDDLYVVDDPGDVIVENPGEGWDTVESSISYALPDNVEKLVLTGTGALTGTGNDLDNYLVGNGGASTLVGGLGDDGYMVDNPGTVIVENPGEGYDTVESTVSYTLPANVEDLQFFGTDDFIGVGNDQANYLSGSEGDDTLLGGLGNDSVHGDLGADLLVGGPGNDEYAYFTSFWPSFERQFGHDVIRESGTADDLDSIRFYGNVPSYRMGVRREGDDLIVYVDDEPENEIRVEGQFADPAQRVEEVVFNDGTVWDEATIAAMLSVDRVVHEDNSVWIDERPYLTGGPGDPLTYDATLTDGSPLPSWLSFDPATRTFSGTPATTDMGTYLVYFFATNPWSLTQIYTTSFHVVGTNDVQALLSPSLDPIATEEAPFEFIAPALTPPSGYADNAVSRTATLADGSPLPAWLTFDPMSSSFYGTPTNADVGTLSLRVTATNAGGQTVEKTFTILVVNTNDPPVPGDPIADQTATGGRPFEFTVPATAFFDEDPGDVLTYEAMLASWEPLPAWLAFDPITGTFSGTPTNGDVGGLAVTVLAYDRGDIPAESTFLLTVEQGNTPPVLVAPLADQSALEDTPFTVTLPAGAFTDADPGDTLTYSATLADGSPLPAWLTFDAGTVTFTGTPPTGSAGATLSVLVTATDLAGASATDIFDLAIGAVRTGTPGADVLIGTAGPDVLQGLAGNDYYVVQNANDQVVEQPGEGTDTVESSVSYVLPDNTEILRLTGSADLSGTGNGAANTLIGNAGANTLTGGLGNDYYVVQNAGDVVLEQPGEGTDTVESSVSYALPANTEILRLTGTADLSGTGNGQDNTLIGNSGTNILAGGLGNDYYVVQNPSDTVVEQPGEGTDTIESSVSYALPANTEILRLTGTGDLTGTGNTQNNTLIGNAGVNVLQGLAGNDYYVVQNAGDVVVEQPGEGLDTVESSVDYALPANTEILRLSGSANLTGTGNTADNTLIGNAGVNVLQGLAGNDYYVVQNAGDQVVEQPGEGTDTVESSVSYALPDNTEVLRLTGSADLTGTGNSADNTLIGNAGTNILTGGLGNDYYVVQNATDSVVENPGEGLDTVECSVSYALPDNIEILLLTGTTDLSGTGNTANNTLIGNAGANTLAGGAGNDYYVVQNPTDTVVEQPGEGTDTIESSVSYALPVNTEILLLTGTADLSGTGNSAANTLIGNAGANTLTGGLGNDYYVVQNAGDVVVEQPGEGLDTVESSVDYALPANTEILRLTGTADLSGTGNGQDNTLIGNAGNNTLQGGAGNDWVEDGVGDETYLYARGDGQDRVTDDAGSDHLEFGADIAYDQLWFQRVADDLEIDLIGTDDKVTVASWYADATYHIERFTTTEGKQLLDSQVDQLVEAMAAFAPPPPGQTTLPEDYRQALAPVLAASWQ